MQQNTNTLPLYNIYTHPDISKIKAKPTYLPVTWVATSCRWCAARLNILSMAFL